jgi:hypothetical protein
MKSAIRICQFLLFAAGLLLVGKPTPTVSAQGGWQTCVQSLSEITEPACASCCSNEFAAGDVTYVSGVSNSDPGFQSMENKPFDCGDALPGGCSKECGTASYPVQVNDGTCCMPLNYGPCYQGTDCCSGICDTNLHSCVSCISYGHSCNPYSGGCCSGICDPYTATCADACVPNYGYCDGLYFNDCCSGICDLEDWACVSCIPSGHFAYSSGLCCGGEMWWDYECW